MIRISLVVPTYNRVGFLTESLPSFLEQSLNSLNYEVLVVDNNSTDNTKEVVHAVLRNAKCEWRYIFEPRQGLHFARNSGISEAAGDIIVFGDDDIMATKGWLENILHEFDDDTSVGVVGGKVKPIWDRLPETWVYDFGTDKVHPVFAYLDYGDKRLELESEYIFGCNFAIRRALAVKIGGSYPDTFPGHIKHLSGTGECAMIDNVRKLNYKIIYSPEAIVWHHADSSRANLSYFIERYQRWAIEEVFKQFRIQGKASASIGLIARAFARMFRSPISCIRKSKPGYCLAIENAAAWQTVYQVLKVLADRSLYEHMTRDGYL